MKKKVIIIISVILALAASLCIINYFLPASVDSGACSGGYKSVVYYKYKDELTDKYFNSLVYCDKIHISNMKAVEINDNDYSDIYNVGWIGRTIMMEFDIEYDHDEKGHVQERLLFFGKRVWNQKYKWKFGISKENSLAEGNYKVVVLE